MPKEWQSLIDSLLVPILWIPGMQRLLLDFFLYSSSTWIGAIKYLLLMFPILLFISAIWLTHLSLYTLPFRSNRLGFMTSMLIAWWDAARAIWLYWVGLIRAVVLIVGWISTLSRLVFKLALEVFRQILIAPITMTGKMTQSYFQPGIPWVAFFMLVFWCLLEATIFTYTLFPTLSEVLADLVGAEPSRYMGSVLFLFLFMLILGSFACVQALLDSIKAREYKFIVQMILVELFVMFFEVLFLYRELVDAITPWIAQQTSGQYQMGMVFTLSLATFAWLGIRGMTWFLFGQFGTSSLLAFISRRPFSSGETSPSLPQQEGQSNWWRTPMEDFKHEIGWLHEKSKNNTKWGWFLLFH